ncbi:long-chain-fatty-acid--CoA ligase [Streptosporangium sp. NPDC000396]|uniref:long-chain-fatty-acid--CoA ligase n=1 Tax=Streptosporangium sp. NPDC000396 TaxID=3366185 RepID=UPI0036CB5AAB
MSGKTLAELLEQRAGDDRPGLLFEDRVWSWREYVEECRAKAAWMDARTDVRGRAVHVGTLLDNVPEMVFLVGGAALSGHVVVALNTTRSAGELARDADATDVDLIVHEPAYAELAEEVARLRSGTPPLARPGSEGLGSAQSGSTWEDSTRAGFARPGAVRPGSTGADEDELVMLIFTSGTSGRPRAVRVTQRKIAVPGTNLAAMLSPRDVVYCSMPLFHSGAIMAAYAPAVASGAALVIRRKFSASGLMPDVRRYGVTYLHYVGKALSYVLATPESPDDKDNTLRIAFGNEGSSTATGRFGERFGCHVIDAFGSTETAIAISPDPAGPPGCLGRLPDGIEIRDPVSGEMCPAAVIEDGRLLNGDEAIGELVNTRGQGLFDGYYNDPEADRERVREGAFWSGDLAYADSRGYVFFAGRGTERLRVDGENLAVAPIETIVREFPGVVEAAVYPVPDAVAGDQVMAALVLDDGFDQEAFAEFLAGRKDVGAKAVPRYIRISKELPQTPSNKVIKRILAEEAWHTGDPVWWRAPGQRGWRPLTPGDIAGIDDEFTRHGRRHLLER